MKTKDDDMSKIKAGQKVVGLIADILNREFSARSAKGLPLEGWQRSAWPSSSPFLTNKKVSNIGAVVWFPYLTDDPNSPGRDKWVNVLNNDCSIITTRYVGEESFDDVCRRIAKFIGKIHIVFDRETVGNTGRKFYGIYSSERVNDTFVYRRIADEINTQDWCR